MFLSTLAVVTLLHTLETKPNAVVNLKTTRGYAQIQRVNGRYYKVTLEGRIRPILVRDAEEALQVAGYR